MMEAAEAWARANGYGDQTAAFIRPEQTPGSAVEAKTFEHEDFIGSKRVHAPLPPDCERGRRLRGSGILRPLRKIQNN